MSKNDFYNVVVSQFAKEDLNEIIAYYESLNKSYVETVITQFEDNILSLSHFPESGRIIPNYTDKVLNGIEKSFRVCIVLCMKFEKKMSSFIQLLIAEEILMKC